MFTMEGWIQILNNTIAKFGMLLPDEVLKNLQRVRDEMETEEANSVPISIKCEDVPEAKKIRIEELIAMQRKQPLTVVAEDMPHKAKTVRYERAFPGGENRMWMDVKND